MTATTDAPANTGHALQRRIGFWGLTFISLGSIIGSGWLLGALTAATVAGGGGSLVSWVLATGMLGVLAVIHADLGAAYPVAGGTVRYPHYAFGGFAGFTVGWSTYLQAVALAPLEVTASLSYISSLQWVGEHAPLVTKAGTLTLVGIPIAVVLLAIFTGINLLGANWLSDSNTGIVLWKVAVPALTVVVLLLVVFHPGNFSAGGGFAPDGFHGIFSALPLGVVFALQGFEQAAQLAGEAKDPRRHLAKAILTAMGIGAVIYIALEVAFVGAIDPSRVTHSWANPLPKGDYGAYYTIAVAAGITWLAVVLIVDAVVSPGGTGLIYIGTSSRISYALGMPSWMRRTTKRGVPIWSVLVAFAFGLLALAPAPSWKDLVEVITDATAIMYAFAPISLAALDRSDRDREHPYRAPLPKVLLPLGFVFANLIAYWSGFDVLWKVGVLILIGQVVFGIAVLANAKSVDRQHVRWRAAAWIWVWLGGLVVIGLLGQYGDSELKVIPEGIDDAVVAVFALVIFFWAVSTAQPKGDVEALVTADRSDEELQQAA